MPTPSDATNQAATLPSSIMEFDDINEDDTSSWINERIMEKNRIKMHNPRYMFRGYKNNRALARGYQAQW